MSCIQVVPVELNETTNAFEFEVPVLLIPDETTVYVAFSLDGQQFMSDHTTTDTTSESAHTISFRYRAPLVQSSSVDEDKELAV